MNAYENFLKNNIAGILILFVFVFTIFLSGCTESGKEPVPNESQSTTNTTEKIEVKCGNINEACCENNTCNSSDLGCIEDKCMNFKITNISTEKPKYTKNEQIKISVSINSTTDVNNVSLHVYGITSRQKQHLIDETRNLNLTAGSNIQNFIVTAPPCTQGCGAKYYPGDYPLYAKVFYVDESNNVSISDEKQVKVNLY